jgi:glycerophosphoryl diester phosphodiesterase
MEISPLLLGHRGARRVKTAPENTFAAFELAVDSGCDGFEFDVRLTSDGQAVICHDPTVEASELAKTRAADVPQLPRFGDVLARYHQHAFLDIELKVGGLEAMIFEYLKRYPLVRGGLVSSFLPEVLRTLREIGPKLHLGLLADTPDGLSIWRSLQVEYIIPHYKIAKEKIVRELRDAGKRVLVWPVNDPGSMRRFVEWGVDGIISDSPSILVHTIRRSGVGQ